MSDAFGALAIPLIAPVDDVAAGDPFLTTSLSFFKAVLNANAPAAWRAIFKDAPLSDPVKKTVDNDPREAGFNDNDLPALYFFRESAPPPDRIADDWLTQETVCRLIWVMPAAVQSKRITRTSIINGIARALMVIVERARDPSWVDVGDPDPQAATLGSSFAGRAGWMVFEVGAWKPMKLTIPMLAAGGTAPTYDAVSITCNVTELLTVDPTVTTAPNVSEQSSFNIPDEGTGLGPLDMGTQIYT